MWKVVLWLNVVWNLYAIEASHHEPYYENLYVRRDGVAMMEPHSIPIYGNDGNETTYLINNNQETIETLRRGRRQRWKGLSPNSRYNKKYRSVKMNLYSQEDVKEDEQLLLLQKAVKYDEESQCVDGRTKFVRCNHCVCMGGQLYICTTRNCETKEKTSQIKSTSDIKHVAFTQKGVCIEGDQIRSFDSCNRCYCGGGQVICTNKKCQGNQIDRRKCYPGKRTRSSDNCNTCTCNTRKIITCTAKTCGPEISKHIEDKACVPNTWFSMSGSYRCRECYCINGKIAFCYMSLCAKRSIKDPSLSRPGSLPDRCQMNDYIQDRCTRCDCGANGVWICQSKIMYNPKYSNKTCNAVPEQLQTYNIRKKVHRRYGFFTPRLPILYKPTVPLYEMLKSTPKPQWTTKSTMTTRQDYDRTTGLEPEDENYDRTTGLEPEDGNYDRTTGLEPEGGNYDRTTGLEPEDEILSEYTKGPGGIGHSEHPDSSGGGGGKFPPRKPGKRPKKAKKTDNSNSENQDPVAPEPGINTNIDRGPHCVAGQFFTQGSNQTCHGCFCTPTNEWKCWSIKDACRGSGPCNPGKMRKNPEAPCSVCYCGADKQSYCATDELCSYSIKPSTCEAIACLNYCATTNANFGVCHVDKCVCVH